MTRLVSTKNVAVFGNTSQDDALPTIGHLFSLLARHGFNVCVVRRFADYLADHGVEMHAASVADDFPPSCSAAISIGGDGTFLRAAQWVGTNQTPLLGLNTGHLGFLASYSINDTDFLIEALAKGIGCVEKRMVLHISGNQFPESIWPYTLNEVAIVKDDSTSMINVEAYIDGIFLADYKADGLIVATPTGSTAYNLSAGGPILKPSLEAIALTPIAPHSLTLRPLVVDGDSVICLRTTSRTGHYRVSLDGHSFIMPHNTELTVRKASFYTAVVRRIDDDFANIMRDKLLWGTAATGK